MRGRHLLIASLLFAAISVSAPLKLAAQEGSTNASLDLAAMALAPDDLPPGFFDDYGEVWYPANAFSELVLGGEPSPPGLELVYQSFYFNPEALRGVYVYLLQFSSPENAAEGAGIVDATLRPPLPEGETTGPTHAPGPALGEEPRRMTIVTYDTWAAGGPRVDVVASTFRRDRLVAGVSVERWTDPPPDGTPAASAATAVAPDPEQEQLAMSLATALDGRITEVFAGNSPPGADLALGSKVLPLDQLVDESVGVWGGFKSGIDLLRCGICGEENSLTAFGEVSLGGFARALPLGPIVDGEPHPPFASVAVSAFASPEDALAVLDAIRQTPNDRPTPGPIPRGTRTLVDDPVIPGATAALAFHAAMDAEDPNAPLDSAGVDFVIGDRLVSVDVQGGLSADDALAAAVDLATQQAACLSSAGQCESATRPAALGDVSGS